MKMSLGLNEKSAEAFLSPTKQPAQDGDDEIVYESIEEVYL